jgi:hypothetical protein
VDTFATHSEHIVVCRWFVCETLGSSTAGIKFHECLPGYGTRENQRLASRHRETEN